MSEPVEIVRVPFHGTVLLTSEVAGVRHIALKPAIEGIGLSYPAQYRKLQGRSWAVVAQTATTGSDGKTYQMVTVDVRTFLMLLATVNENQVAEDLRPLLIAYQREVADAIESYWTKGAAVRPGVEVGPQHEVPQTFAQALRLAAEQLERAEAAEGKVSELETENTAQKQKIAADRPKVTYVEKWVDPRKDTTTFTVFAKQLGMRSAHQLYEELKARERIWQRVQGRRRTSKGTWESVMQWLPRAGYEHWFKVLEQPDAPPLHNGQKQTTLYILPPGKVGIADLLAADDQPGGAA